MAGFDFSDEFKKFSDNSVSGVSNLVNSTIKFADAARNAQGSASSGPWSGLSSENSFFKPIQIDGERWNKLYPYRLLVWDMDKGGVAGIGSTSPSALKVFTDYNSSGKFTLSFEPMGSKWEFRLPITPQQLSINTPYAITTTPTLRGIVEEHAGVKFKMINCAGTMGVWPSRKNLNGKPENPTIFTTLFSGTVQAFGGVINQVDRTLNAIQGHPAPNPTKMQPNGVLLESTGYYQALLLDQFLEQYAEAKKDPANAAWRLVFDIPKENQSFVVTPVQFSYSKSVDSPNEIRYTLQFKAWQRIDITGGANPSEIKELKLEPDLLSKLINSVEEARRTLGAAYNLVKAVRSDFQTPFNILREISLFAKDLAGFVISAVDLPRQIIQDSQSAIKDVFVKNLSLSYQNYQDSSTLYAIQSIQESSNLKEGVSDSQIASGQLGNNASSALQTDPVSEIFKNPEQNFELFNSITSDNISFNFAQRDIIDADLESIKNTTVDDLIQDRAKLLELALQISDAFGAGSEDYDSIYDRSAPKDRIQEMTIDEFSILRSIYDVIQNLDSITATNEIDQGRIQNAFEYVGGLANDSGINFDTSSISKIRVPVPYGLSMEQISARFLGDPDRWMEIATLNALRSPYIDEDGFYYNLLSNADGRRFNVNTNQNIFVGQKIYLSSLTQNTITRRIIDIEKINSTNYLVTVDGLDNLDAYTITDNAKMKAFLPGTVNSLDQIYIPSELEATETVLSRPIPSTAGDPLVGLSKVDWLIGENNDVVIDSFGNFKLAAGLSNLIQALKMKFSTQPGKLLKHPEYGAGLTPGVSTADLNNSDVISQIVKSIENDPRYGKILSLKVEKNGPTYSVGLAVTLADGSGVFPISFVLNQ